MQDLNSGANNFYYSRPLDLYDVNINNQPTNQPTNQSMSKHKPTKRSKAHKPKHPPLAKARAAAAIASMTASEEGGAEVVKEAIESGGAGLGREGWLAGQEWAREFIALLSRLWSVSSLVGWRCFGCVVGCELPVW